jgi:hypothetical protein
MTPQEQITGKVDDLPDAASLGDDPLATLSKEAHNYGLKLTSNLRSPAKNKAVGGAPNSYHLEGAGYDFSGNPQAMKAFTQHLQETYGPSLRELYHDPVGGWKNGQSVGPVGGHTNHVHVAAYPQMQGNVNDLPDTSETVTQGSRVASLLTELTDPNRPANRNAQARPVKQSAPRKVPGEALSQQFEEAKAKGDLVSARGYAAQLKQKGWEVGADQYGNPYVKPPKGYQYQTTQPSLQTDLLSGRVNAPAPPSPTVLQQLGSGIERMSGGVYSGLGSGVAGTGRLLHFKPTEELGQTMMGMGSRLTRQAQEHGSTGVVGDVLGAAGEVLPLLTLPGGASAIGAVGGLQSYGRGATLPEAALQGAATGVGVAGGGALASKIPLKGLSGLAARSVAATAGMEAPQIALTGQVPTARDVLPNLLLMGGLEAMHGTPERVEGRVADLPETAREAKSAQETPKVVPEQIQGHVNDLPVSAGKGLSVEGEGLGVPAVQPRVPPQSAEPATVIQRTPSLEPQVSAVSIPETTRLLASDQTPPRGFVEGGQTTNEPVRSVTKQAEHHSELQPRDPETQQFSGPPEGYTPKVEQEGKQRSLPKTLEEANLPGGTNRTYEPTSNESSLAKAEQNIKTKGLDGAAEWVKGEAEPSAEHTATGLKVISELQKAGRYDDAVDVASDLSDKLTRQGQAIQAVQVLNQLSPERALLVAQRMAKKYKTQVDAKAITEKAATAQADDARLRFLEGEVERLTNEAAKSAPKKPAPKGLNGRLNERAQNALAKLQGRPVDLKGISQGAELGAVTVGKPSLQGDAELLAEYGASTLDKPMDDWKADLRTRFGNIPDAQLDTIAKRAYDIRSEERVNDLAERMASGDVKTRRSAGAEIGQSIRDATKAAKQAEQAAIRTKQQTVAQDADTATRTARIQEGLRLDAEKEDARQRLADARREGIEAKRQADKIERERIASEKNAAKKAAQWTAPFKAAADAARQAKTDEPMSLDDTIAVAADIIAPKTPQESVARGLTAARFYKEIEAQTGVGRKTAKEAFKQAYQRVSDARTAAREAARINAATGGQAGALTDAQLQSVLAQREAAQRDANRSRQDLASEFQKLQMTTPQRVVYNLVRGSRQVLLSGITTVEKLGAFGAVEQVMRPARDLVGAGWQEIAAKDSWLNQVAAQAPREGGGFNARAQAAGLAKYLRTTIETFTPGESDVRNYIKTGHSDIDVKFGKASSLPPEVTEFFGRLHGALKTPARLAEFETSARIRLEDAIKRGLDPTDPMTITTAMEGAYMDANRSIMLADNMISDFISAGKQKLRQTGHPYAAMGLEALMPITKVPVNIVAETGRYSPLSAVKSVGEILYRGMRGTLDQLEPNEADRIMRNLKKGTLGTMLYAMAYAMPNIIQLGGYKKKGEKEEDLAVKPETMKAFGVDIGKQWIHHPIFITMQTMQTIRRLHDQYGYTDASLTAVKQNLEHVPYLEEPAKALEAFGSEGAMRNFIGALIRSRIEPPDLQRAARIGDQPETTTSGKVKQFLGLTPEEQATRRYPATMGEMMQMGIPGQREKVPVVSVSRTIQTPTATYYLSDSQYAELRKATSDSVNEAMKTARSKLSDLTPKQRLAASQYITAQIMSRERDRLKLKLDKEYADSAAGDNAFDRLHQPLEEIISDARDKLSEEKFNKKPRIVAQ